MFVNDAFREDDVQNLINTELTYLHAKVSSGDIAIPTLIYPDSNASNILLQTNFVWTNSKNAVKYRLQVASAQDFSNNSIIIDEFTQDTIMLRALPNDNQFYHWRVKAILNTDSSDWTSIWLFKTDNASGVEDAKDNQFQISPNPASNELNIAYTLQNSGDYSIMIYNSMAS